MKKILEFLSENFQFLVVKFSVYLNRRVFVMQGAMQKRSKGCHKEVIMIFQQGLVKRPHEG